MSRTLTFDLGTSYFKVCLFDETLRLAARHSLPVPITAQEAGRCELAVRDFDHCLDVAVRELSRDCGGLGNVTKVCFASQANTFTLLGNGGTPLMPFLVWSDQRACEDDTFAREFAAGINFYRETGIAQLDHQFMVAKLHWLQQHSPALVNETRRVCTLSDYFVWRLTGNFLTEAGLAGLTGLVNIHQLRYRADALERSHLTSAQLPPIVRAGSDVGRVRPPIVADWGLSPDCRLVMGCLDQYAGAIGAGITSAGGVCETTGTVLATVRCARGFSEQTNAGVFQGPAFTPGLYFQMVFSSLSAGVLERYRNRLPDRPSFDELDRLAAEVPTGAEGLQFNRAAILDDSIEMFLARTARHRHGHEVRAILEAVARELKEQVATLCGDDLPAVVKSCGGAARSRLWLDIKREIVGCDFEPINCPEPTSLGAARLTNELHMT